MQRPLLEDNVRVRATRPEAADTRTAWSAVLRYPGRRFALNAEGCVLESYVRIWWIGMDRWREPLMLHLEQDLDYAGDAGCGFGVANVGFHRSKRAVAILRC